MKQSVVFALLVFLTIPAFGQLTIRDADVRALLGQTITRTSFFAQGGQDATLQALIDQDGASQTWDFTAVAFDPNGEPLTTTYSATIPAGAPGGGEAPFNTANFVATAEIGQDSTAYAFQDLRNDGLYFIGFSATTGSDEAGRGSYAPPILSLPLPATFGSDWESDAMYTVTAQGNSFTIQEERDNEIDGFGTLRLPSGEAQVLRQRQTITTMVSGFTTTQTIYLFYNANGESTASISVSDPGFGLPKIYSASYSAGAGGGTSNPPTSAPSNLSPGDGATDQPTSLTLDWDAVENADTYDLQVATDANFKRSATHTYAVIVDETGLTNTSFGVTGLEPGTAYFWRVRGVNADGVGPWSSPIAFATADDTGTAVEDVAEVPRSIQLYGNYPNPFNPETRITYALPKAMHVHLDVYDSAGRYLTTLVDGMQPAGTHEASFEGARLPSGLYHYRLTGGKVVLWRSMLLIK